MDQNTKNTFVDSIDKFNISDTNQGQKRNPLLKMKKKGLDPVRLFVVFLCLAVFSYSTYSLFEIFRSNVESETLYGDIYNSFSDIIYNNVLAQKAEKPNQSSLLPSSAFNPNKGGNFNSIQNNTTSLKFQQTLSKLETLRSQNPDIVGYISISGTGINYPLLQSEDNEYYLDHGFDNTYMKSGSIFYDYRSSSIPDMNRNLIIYGHNMLNGSMFQQLEHFTENEELFKSSTITIYSFEGIYTYDIFSVYFVDAYSNYLDITFRDDDEFLSWCEERLVRSLFKDETKFNADSHIVSLSTCINATSTGRIAVHGVLTNVER